MKNVFRVFAAILGVVVMLVSFSAFAEEEYEICMFNCALNIEFCNIEGRGAEQAAADLGNVKLNYFAPMNASSVTEQVDMINTAIASEPDALMIAALDSQAIQSALLTCKEKGIAVLGFDCGIVDPPEGTVRATVATDNKAAAALAAEEMMNNEAFAEAVKNATAENPVLIAALLPDIGSQTTLDRLSGFCTGMKELAEEYQPGAVEVSGHVSIDDPAESDPAVLIQLFVPGTSDEADIRNSAQAVLLNENLIGLFCFNEAVVSSVLSATNDGLDLDRENGKYKDLIVVGFDSGKTQMDAIRAHYLYGSVTQNPYQIGYQCVMLAYEAITGGEISNKDSGALWYDASNIDDPEVAQVLYD